MTQTANCRKKKWQRQKNNYLHTEMICGTLLTDILGILGDGQALLESGSGRVLGEQPLVTCGV